MHKTTGINIHLKEHMHILKSSEKYILQIFERDELFQQNRAFYDSMITVNVSNNKYNYVT